MIIQICVMFLAIVTYSILEWDIRCNHCENTAICLNDSADTIKGKQGALTKVNKTEQCLSQGGDDSKKGEENPALCVL